MGHDTPPLWDRALREQLIDGEAAALAEVYDRFASLAYGIAQRVLDDDDLTEQVTAEVFAHLWESPEDFDPDEGPIRSWIAAEAQRRAVDRLRQRVESRLGSAAVAAPEPAAVRLRDASVTARADYIFTAMPAPLREAVELTRFQHQDYGQMAYALGISEAEACRRLRLCLQMISSAVEYPAGTSQEEP